MNSSMLTFIMEDDEKGKFSKESIVRDSRWRRGGIMNTNDRWQWAFIHRRWW